MKKSILYYIIAFTLLPSINSYSQLTFSTFLDDVFVFGISMKVDNKGNSFVSGYTDSSNFPVTTGAYQTIQKGYSNVFVTKFNSTGNKLVFSTYIGGVGQDEGYDISIDIFGNSYITGECGYLYPTTAGSFKASSAISQVYITKLNSTGNSLIYSTCIGEALGISIVIDTNSNAYITGETEGAYPTSLGAYDKTYNGNSDAFITKMNSFGSGIIFSTFIGGNGADCGLCNIIDPQGNSYISGWTQSGNFPTTADAFQRNHCDGLDDGFLSKLNSTGTTLLFSTYLGGNYDNEANSNAIDNQENSYITGNTRSNNFPVTTGSYDTNFNGGWDIFISKFNSLGSSLVYSTYIGGSNMDESYSLVLDKNSNAYITGYTYSNVYPNWTDNFPVTNDAFDTSFNGGLNDAFISKINNYGNKLIYSSYIGGKLGEQGDYIVLDSLNNIYLAGMTSSNNFPVTSGAFDTIFNINSYEGFIMKLNICGGEPKIQAMDTISFPTFCIGSYPQQDTFYIYNTSSSCVLSLNSMTLSETNSSEFARILPNYFPFYVQPGDSVQFVVEFNPNQIIGTKTAKLSINNNSFQNPYIINLSGTRKAPIIQSDTNIIFPLIECSSEAQDTFYIHNTGTCDLILNSDSISGINKNEFLRIYPANLPITISAGDSTKYIVKYNTNDSVGTQIATLYIINNSSSVPWIVHISAMYDSIAIKINNKESDTIDIDLGTVCPGSTKDTSISLYNKSSVSSTFTISDLKPPFKITGIEKPVIKNPPAPAVKTPKKHKKRKRKTP